ncbi:MAG: hypothetical protein AB1Z98_40140 [Nannocystaceae bacterium]
MATVIVGVALCVVSSGCPSDDGQQAPTTTVTSLGVTSLDSQTGSETTAMVDETGTPKLDVGNETAGSDGIDTGDEGCKKVDLLFVIDNSGSMADEQANLVAAFPGFIAAMQQELAETDGYNIGVVTSDVYIYDLECSPLSVGNLVYQTGGPDSSNGNCGPYTSGLNFMTENDDLADKFACAGQVGTGGDGDERPMDAMIAALTPPLVDEGGCNEGFLRDDALLVVVLITDEEDDPETMEDACNGMPLPGSSGSPGTWFDALVDIKGKEQSVVVLSLVGPDGNVAPMCPALDKCNGGIVGAEVATRILEFTSMFTFGFVGQVCGDYGPIFQEAIGVIKTACDEFDPVG